MPVDNQAAMNAPGDCPVFERLRQFISTEMRMTHIYQPVMIQALLRHEGRATVRQVAEALLAKDEAQLSYYDAVTKRYPGEVLRRHNVLQRNKGGYERVGYDDLTPDERQAGLLSQIAYRPATSAGPPVSGLKAVG